MEIDRRETGEKFNLLRIDKDVATKLLLAYVQIEKRRTDDDTPFP